MLQLDQRTVCLYLSFSTLKLNYCLRQNANIFRCFSGRLVCLIQRILATLKSVYLAYDLDRSYDITFVIYVNGEPVACLFRSWFHFIKHDISRQHKHLISSAVGHLLLSSSTVYAITFLENGRLSLTILGQPHSIGPRYTNKT